MHFASLLSAFCLHKSRPDNNSLESHLVFLGMAGLIDPPRPEAYAAVKSCQHAGIRPIMITGDHKNYRCGDWQGTWHLSDKRRGHYRSRLRWTSATVSLPAALKKLSCLCPCISSPQSTSRKRVSGDGKCRCHDRRRCQ